MTTPSATEDLLRELAPQVLAALVRRYRNFADAEDAAQEALIAAAAAWPREGQPDNPLGWLVRVASRRLANAYRSEEARRRREQLAASWSVASPDPATGRDDTLILMFMCCHPSLSPALAIPLTLRAVGGLTTREIAAAFLVPEATMAQRISRAKAKIQGSGEPFALPAHDDRPERFAQVLHVVYLLYNEGYTTSSGPDLARTDLSGEAIRLARAIHAAAPEEPEAAGLLALMLLTEARRPARSGPDGELVPLGEQDRSRWDRRLVVEGLGLLTEVLQRGRVGEYQIQASIAALHDQAPDRDRTDWPQILTLYGLLEAMTQNPMARLNRAAAAAMAQGPDAGLALLDGLDQRLGDHHRLHAVRAHLLEQAGDGAGAAAEFRAAAARATNLRERQYLTTKAARLAAGS
ncbi:MAG TPA: sigma-70 family RNA polymerase sigma factor [Streptosporangiaceae bacterium]|nr:sigma-70 family RNA polymerase sigma factor [Streptosporangiaceae bacterium]